MGTNYRKAKKVYGFYKTRAQRAAQYFQSKYYEFNRIRKDIESKSRNPRKLNYLRRWARINKKRFEFLKPTHWQREKYRKIAQRRHPPFTYMSYMEYKNLSHKAKNELRAMGLGWYNHSGTFKSYERWQEENMWWMIKQRDKWKRLKARRLRKIKTHKMTKKEREFLYRRRVMMRTNAAAQKEIQRRNRLIRVHRHKMSKRQKNYLEHKRWVTYKRDQ